MEGFYRGGGWGKAAVNNGKERIILNSDVTEGWGMSFVGWKRKGKVFSCRLSPLSVGDGEGTDYCEGA